jgi:hypothetical protein
LWSGPILARGAFDYLFATSVGAKTTVKELFDAERFLFFIDIMIVFNGWRMTIRINVGRGLRPVEEAMLVTEITSSSVGVLAHM